MKYSLLKKQIIRDLNAGLVPFVEGAPGIGKSALFEDVSTSDHYDDFISFILSVTEQTDINGFPNIGKETAYFVPVMPLAKIFNTDKRILVLFDDFGQASNACQAAVMQLIHGGRLNGHVVGKNVRFAIATNRTTDRAGVNRILTPIINRTVKRPFDLDLNDWVSWALNAGIDTKIIAFARFRPDCLTDFEQVKNENIPFCSCRSLEYMSKSERAGIEPGAEYEVICGNIGERFGSEYAAFRQIFLTMPNPDVVLMNPDKAPIPEDPAALYAICGALARKSSDNTIDRLITYAGRLPAEFSVLLIRDCVQACSSVVNSRSFIQWASDNSDVLI